jgi:regulator of replication initiation timing
MIKGNINHSIYSQKKKIEVLSQQIKELEEQITVLKVENENLRAKITENKEISTLKYLYDLL